jgi:LPS export ABC transporter protein LptC
MEQATRRRISAVDLRARVPLLARAAALLLLISGGIFVGVSYYKMRHNQPFRLKSEAPALSKEITGIINGYEQRITKDNRLYLWLRAAKDITYSDGHHELEEVNLQVFSAAGSKPDIIGANRAIYDQNTGVIQLNGNVQIETRDALKVKTETISYNQNTEIGDTAAPVTFERENVSGRATGAMVDGKSKHLELRSDVEIIVAPEAAKDANAKSPNPKGSRAKPVTIHSAQAMFDQATMLITFSGGATAEQDRDIMTGDNLIVALNPQKRVQRVEVRGNSYLRAMDEGHAAEMHSVDMTFFFDADQRLETAVAARDVRAQSLEADSEMQLTGANSAEAKFQAQGDRSLLKEMHTNGRSVVTLGAPKSRPNDPRAANKRLTADSIKLVWHTTGRDLERAEAAGNAELFVDPVQKTSRADRKTMTAPRFDCDFYESGNLARNFLATGGAKVVLEAVIPVENRSVRTMTSQKMTAVFTRETQDTEKVEAQGDVKFNESERNGVAGSASYTDADKTLRLRGGEPTVWDSRARTKATEIDSDTANHISYCRGKVQSTYYSQEQTNGATPFQKVKSPVYIVSDRAEFKHDQGIAVYSGNARAWQDDNFVRADTLTLLRDQKRMEGRGHVQSALYQARQKTEKGTVVVPVFATSEFIRYSDPDRLLNYETNVDIKQGTDRVTAGLTDVYLMKDTNEVERMIAQRNVVLTQPGKSGNGDWLQYTAADEVAVLKGNPAHVQDAEQGTTDGNRLTLYRRENRVVVDDNRSEQSPGRVRSTHKVNKAVKP